ncbi:TetR/AcrR family transcriptional regulator [Deinococcus sp. QL22]|uniref:TetR/AcrR family transcriptional regulator n=1 Tax=Deinococcus sp. QL22 TaxID=2939437 RepID=UPI002016BC18|nr:TetR/AcrR family transcriptional regulator [Deinococcus sp. QL22]UQN09353.1 TetR/AcrR family transcriptional regulator [Deinococcus sp. QL22]
MTALEHRKRLPSADRREQILKVGAALFVERGYEAVTMGDIATALGISRPTIYSYFTSTEGVLDALLDERLDTLLTLLEPLLNTPPETEEGSNRIEAIFELLLRERDTFSLLHSGGGPTFRQRRHDFLNKIGQRLPLVPNPPGQEYATLLLIITTLLDSLVYRAANDPTVNATELARALQKFVQGGARELLQGSVDSVQSKG